MSIYLGLGAGCGLGGLGGLGGLVHLASQGHPTSAFPLSYEELVKINNDISLAAIAHENEKISKSRKKKILLLI